MSIPLLPFAFWASGTNQNSIPANDNSRRNQILNGEVISQVIAAQPSGVEGAIYILPASPTGAQWATFTAKDLVIYSGGTWYAFAPVEGVVVNVAGTLYKYDSGAWAAVTTAGGMTNPMTTVEDIIKGGATGTPTRVAVGTNGQVLSVTAGAVGWATPSAGFANPMTTAEDIIKGGGSGAPARLAVGSNGNVLTVTAGAVGWAAPASGFTNPMTTIGDLIVGDTGGAAIRLANGTAGFVLTAVSGAPAAWTAPAGGSVTGFTSALNTSSPNNTVNASSLAASGGTTNQDAVFAPKGAGSIIAQIPDSTATGGNKRGTRAVDLQLSRSAAANIAAGNDSFAAGTDCQTGATAAVAMGSACIASGTASFAINTSTTASGARSFAGGLSSTSSADYAFAYGQSLTASGTNAAAVGGNGCVASGLNSITLAGKLISTRSIVGMVAFGANAGVVAKAQGELYSLGGGTSSTTPQALVSNASGAGTTNQLILVNSSGAVVTGVVIGHNATNRAMWKFEAAVNRGANAAATTVDANTVTLIYATGGASAWALAIAADTTNGGMAVNVTGAAATNISWQASLNVAYVAD